MEQSRTASRSLQHHPDLNGNFEMVGLTVQLFDKKPTPSYVEVVALSGKLRVPISTDLRELR